MLFQPTNIIPDTRTGIGFGVFDVTGSMQISWQVNGDYPLMTAFRIVIYSNNAASTQLYDTGRLTTGCPFYGRDAKGEVEFFSYTIQSATLASAGITNGNEYKYVIRQYYMEAGVETSVLQSSASVFITRTLPTFTMDAATVDAAEYTFSWNFSQAQGDTIEWIRYQIQVIDGGSSETIYDSGSIYGPAQYQCTYSGFLVGQSYAIRALGQTSSGVSISTEWDQFSPNYAEATATGSITADCVAGYDAIKLSWTNASTTSGQNEWIVYRRQSGKLALQKIGEFPVSVRSVYDFGAASGQGPYTYYLFQAKAANPQANPPTPTQYLSAALVSDEISPVRYYWSLLDCEDLGDGMYHVLREFDFTNNLSSSSIGNNNDPSLLQNFTAMPTVQLSPSNYKSGSLSALIGTVDKGSYGQDTLALREAIMGLSTTQDTLFLKSSKGDVMTIVINGAISVEIKDTTPGQPQIIQVPWVQIDDSPASLIAYPTDNMFLS